MLKFVIVFCAAVATPVFPAVHQVPEEEPLVTIEIPNEWQTKEIGESLQATAPSGSFHVLIIPSEAKVAETIGEAMRYIRNTGGITVKRDSMKDERVKLGDLNVRQILWDGKNNSGDIKIQFTILPIAERGSMLVASWGPPNAGQKHEADLKKILQSIKKV
jgi:hypothetical protein